MTFPDGASTAAAGDRSGDPARSTWLSTFSGNCRLTAGSSVRPREWRRRPTRPNAWRGRCAARGDCTACRPLFLAVALLLFGGWVYWNFFHVATLTVALPEEDASQLRERLSRSGRVRFQPRTTAGSRESVQLLLGGKVDLAFVQGGIPIAEDLPRLQNPSSEVVLYFVRDGVRHPGQVRKILTSAEGQGSHSVAQVFAGLWKISEQIQFVARLAAVQRRAGVSPFRPTWMPCL